MSDQPPMFLRRPEGVVFRRLSPGEGSVLLKLDSGAYHGLNETGSLLWELIAEGIMLPELVEQFRHRVDDPPGDVAAAVALFVEDLRQRGLLVVEGVPLAGGDATDQAVDTEP